MIDGPRRRFGSSLELAVALAAVVALVAIVSGCGPSTTDRPVTARDAPAGRATVVTKLTSCIPDQNGQRVCTDGQGLTIPEPTLGEHDDAADCTWAATTSSSGRRSLVCRSGG